MATRNFVAIDLGAESGRVALGQFDGRGMALSECKRFPNGPIRLRDRLVWDVPGLWRDMTAGLGAATAAAGSPPAAVAIDTWGVDFGFVRPDGQLHGLPVCYRDDRTAGMMEKAFGLMPKAELYRRTGAQFMPFNSLYQMMAIAEERRFDPFANAARLLFVPDLFNSFLCGVEAGEFTVASTSQMLDPHTRNWDRELLATLGVPTGFLPTVRMPGERLGPLLEAVAAETGARGTQCVLTASHDTAAAVVAVPATGHDWCFISSGTWSLMGAEIPAPNTGPEALAENFTNEGGVFGTTRFLKNIMGLWLVQQLRKALAKRGTEIDYAALAAQAAAAAPFAALVDPDHPTFLSPADMGEALSARCVATGQTPPRSAGGLARLCFESLALKYRKTLEGMERVLGRRFGAIHIVGGGSKNSLLCRMTADCCRRPVIAGPAEGTALGNLMMQAHALGELSSLAEIRAVVRASSETADYEPDAVAAAAWDQQYGKFLALPG